MIIATTEDLKKHVPVTANFEFTDFQPYINKAVNSYTRKYVGALHAILADVATGNDAVVKNEARDLLQSAIANFGWFKYLPFATVLMDGSGISVAQNDHRKSAEWWQIKDIRREFLKAGHDALDLLLEVLEANPSIFTDYATNYNTINNELIVNRATIFSKYYNIFNSRQTFLALMPTIRLIEDQYVHTFLCPELITVLKTDVSDNILLVKTAMQKAIVAFTVAQVAATGLFLLDEKGLRIDFENFSDGRKQSPEYGKTSQQVQQLMNTQIDNGTQYLKQAKKIIENNIADFNQCAAPLVHASETGSGFTAHDTTGVLGL